MYANPNLFPPISTRESWGPIIVQIADGDTGDLIELEDDDGDSLYDIALEIIESSPPAGNLSGYGVSPWIDGDCSPIISGSLDNYISIVGTGTFQILIPKSVIQSLRARTYDIFATISPIGEDDGRQLWIGRLPVLYGGRNI